MKCQNCGALLKEGTLICPNCAAEVHQAPPPRKLDPQKVKRVRKRKWVLAAAAVGLVIVVAGGVAIGVASAKPDGSSAPVLFVKEGGLYAQNIESDEPFRITPSYAGNGRDQPRAAVKEDGTYLFYTDSLQEDGSFKLYYRDLDGPVSKVKDADSEKGQLISTNVTGAFQTDADLAHVAYLKGGDKLRVHDRKTEATIDSGVSAFQISQDGNKIIYGKPNGRGTFDLYRASTKGKGNPERLAVDVTAFYALDLMSLDTVAYTRRMNEDAAALTLYVQGRRGEAQTVSENATQVFLLPDEKGETNGLYFTQILVTEKSWSELLTDDLVQSDAAITEPQRGDYGERADFDAAVDAYDTKLLRDEIRGQMEQRTLSVTNQTLSLYDAKQKAAVPVASGIDTLWTVTQKGAVYVGHEPQTLDPMPLSALESYGYRLDDAEEQLTKPKAQALALCAPGGEPTVLLEDFEESSFLGKSANGRFLYLAENLDAAAAQCDLYQYDLKKLTEVKKTKLDVSVHVDSLILTEAGGVYYRKDVDADEMGALYAWSGKKPVKLADQVRFVQRAGMDSIFYFTDYSPAADAGTLSLCRKTRAEKIDENVKAGSCTYRDGGHVLYLRGYDADAGYGQIFWYREKGNKALIGEHVSQLLS